MSYYNYVELCHRSTPCWCSSNFLDLYSKGANPVLCSFPVSLGIPLLNIKFGILLQIYLLSRSSQVITVKYLWQSLFYTNKTLYTTVNPFFFNTKFYVLNSKIICRVPKINSIHPTVQAPLIRSSIHPSIYKDREMAYWNLLFVIMGAQNT
jgi:hypothetical protein